MDPTETPIEAAKQPSKLDQARSILSNMVDDRKLQTSVNYGVSLNPDEAAKSQKLSTEFQVPLDVATANPHDLDLASKRKDILKKLEGTQILKAMMKDSKFAAIAHDDVDKLRELEHSIGAMKYLSGIGTEFAVRSATGVEGILTQWRHFQEETAPIDLGGGGWGEGLSMADRATIETYRTAQQVRQEAMPNFSVPEWEYVYSGFSSLASQLPGYGLSILGGPWAGLTYLGAQTQADAYLKYLERGGTRGEAFAGATLEGGIEIGTELIPMNYFVNKFGKAGIAEFVGGIVAREVPTEIAATIGQEITDTMIANPDKSLADLKEEFTRLDRGNVIYQTIIATLANAGGMGALNIPMRMAAGRYGTGLDQAQRQIDSSVAMDDLVQKASNSTLRQRDPKQFKNFLEKQLGIEDSVYLAPEDAQTFFQAHPEVLEALPESSAQAITEALAMGSDVAVSKADYLTYFTDFHAEIADMLRNDMDGMTTAEANRWQETQQQEFETAANQILTSMDQESDFAISANKVQQYVTDQLVSTGRMTPEIAAKNAELYKSFAVVTAQKMNITPEQVMEKFGMRVQGAPVTGEGVLNQMEQAEYESALAKGLDMSTEARMQRAKAMGYGDQIWYHANTGGIVGEGFDPAYLPNSDPDRPFVAFWFGSKPSEFAAWRGGTGNTITPVMLKLDPSKEAKTKDYKRVARQLYNELSEDATDVNGMSFAQALRQRLLDEGYTHAVRGREAINREELEKTGKTSFYANGIKSYLEWKKIREPSFPAYTDQENKLFSDLQEARDKMESYRAFVVETIMADDAVPAEKKTELKKTYADLVEKYDTLQKQGNAASDRAYAEAAAANQPVDSLEYSDDVIGGITGYSSLEEFERMVPEQEDIAVFDPSIIRSINAAFDPDFQDSANLLAQGPVSNAMEQYRREEEKRPIKDLIKEPIKNKDGEYRRNAQGDITGAPIGVKTEEHIQEIVDANVDHMEDPLAQMPSSAEWYEVSGEAIRAVTHGDPVMTERMVRMMAVLSATNQVGGNTTGAIKAIYQLARGEVAAAGRFPNKFREISTDIINAKDMNLDVPGVNDKVMSFYRNLWDATFQSDKYENAATMDMWMARLYGYQLDTFGPAQYRFANMVTQRITDQYNAKHGTNLKPRMVQAALWVYARNREKFGSNIGADIALDDRSAFDTYIDRAKQNITVEAVPSVDSGLFPEIHTATPAQKAEYTRQAFQLLLNEQGENQLFKALDIPLYQAMDSEGTFEGAVSPNAIMRIVAEKQGGEYDTTRADLAARALQYIYTQDGVPWFQLDPTLKGTTPGVAVRFSAQPTVEIEEAFLEHLNQTVEADFTRIGNDFILLNFTGLSNAKFLKAVVDAAETYEGPGSELIEEIKKDVKAKGNYLDQDWSDEDAATAQIEGIFRDAERSDLLPWLRDRREAVARLQADFRDEQLAQTFNQAGILDRAIEARFVDKLGLEQTGVDTFNIIDEAKFQAAIEEYSKLDDAGGGKVLNTDTARELSPDYLADRTQSASVHEPASFFVKELYRRKLQETPAKGEMDQVLFTAGGTGAGKSSALRVVPQTKFLQQQSHIVMDTNMNTLGSAQKKVQQALDADKQVIISLVVRDPVDALVNGAFPRAERQRKEHGTGRTVPMNEHLKTHQGAPDVIETLAEQYKDDPRVLVIAIDNTRGKGNAAEVELEKIPKFDYTDTWEGLLAARQEAYEKGQISKETYDGFAPAEASQGPEGIRQEGRTGDGGQYQQRGQESLAERKARLERGGFDTSTVYYHGTTEDFNAFRLTMGRPFISLSPSPTFAEGFAEYNAEDPESTPSGARLIPVFIRAEKTFDYENINPAEKESLGEYLATRGRIAKEHIKGIEAGDWSYIETREVLQWMQQQGYDSFFTMDEGVKNIHVFNPSNIRSVNAQGLDMQSGDLLAQQNRGQIQLTDQGALITLLENADLSTFLHESGHFFFEAYKVLAKENDAIRKDMDALLAFVGVDSLTTWENMTADERRDGHEKVARAFEAYLFEGKSPSLEMQSLFDQFRSWLVEVYRNLRNLNVNLTDEVREVFDRMLATDEQIRARTVANGYAPLFESQEDSGMTPAQWQEYQALNDMQQKRAQSALSRRSLKDMQWLDNARSRLLREMQAEHKAARKAMRNEIAEQVRKEPVYYAMHFLRTGETADAEGNTVTIDAHKMNRAEFQERYPDISLNQVRGMTEADGVPMDILAEQLGWTSGDEMVQAILKAEPMKDRIERITDQRMQEEHGEVGTPEKMAEAANEAVHGEAHTRFLHTEMTALSKMTGTINVLARAAKAFARQAIQRKKVKDIKPNQYTQAEARAGRNAEKAIRSGDRESAAEHKRAQVLNNHFFRAANQAKKDIEKAIRYFKKFDREGTRKNLDVDYLDQIDKLLEHYDFRQVSQKKIDQRKALSEWVEDQRKMGFDPLIDERLLADMKRQHYRETTVEELMGLYDTVKNIEHLGRLKKKLIRRRDQMMLDEAAEQVAGTVYKFSTGKNKVKIEHNSWLDRVKKGTAEFFAMHRKFASIARQMDGLKDGGNVWEFFVRPLNEAGDAEAVMREKATMVLHEIFKPLMKMKLREKTYIPEIGQSLSREGRILIALNQGNELNRSRVMTGDGWGADQVQAILDTLTKEEWDFVQETWDFIDSYWPEIAAKEKRVSGVVPEKVQATPVQTKFGEYPGGYFPIMYDTERSTRSEQLDEAEIAKQMMQGTFTRATTRRGHTKQRFEGEIQRPVRKDFGAIFQHVDQVIHDLAYHEWLIDANRLLSHPQVDRSIREAYGPEVLKMMRDTVRDVAAGDIGARNMFERAINHLRAGATITGMGWSLWTSLLQPLGLSQSMVRIGPKWVGRGIAEFFGNAAKMESTGKKIFAKSDFMRLRGKTLQREINEIRNKVSSGGRVPLVTDSYFYLIMKTQQMADFPTWLGQYYKAVESGADEATAVAQADQAVIDSQGGGQIKDLAQIQRGSPLLKLWTNFYSYFNVTMNLTAESFSNIRKPTDVGRFAVDMLLLYSLPATISALMREALKGQCDGDEDCITEAVVRENLSYMAGALVGVREMSGALAGYYGYSGPPGTRFFSEASKLAGQLSEGEADAAMWRALNQTAGVVFHYPAAQVQRTAEGMMAIAEGDVEGMEAVKAPLFGPPR